MGRGTTGLMPLPPPHPRSFSVASRLCPPFLIFSSIWRACAHPPRQGLQLRGNATSRSLARGRATTSNSVQAGDLWRGPSLLCASVSPVVVG